VWRDQESNEMSDEEYEYEYDEDGMDYDSPAGSDADDGDDISIQIANAFYEADGAGRSLAKQP
jgi:hypothetical protein